MRVRWGMRRVEYKGKERLREGIGRVGIVTKVVVHRNKSQKHSI